MGKRVSNLLVSVLTPSGKMFDNVYLAAAACCRGSGAECERVEAEFSNQSALAHAQSQISKAGLIVADITGKNPNVLYLIGYAHALKTKVILLAQHGEDLPFDRRDLAVVIYAGNVAVLKTELRQLLRQGAGQPVNGVPSAAATKELEGAPTADREEFLSLFGDILQAHDEQHGGNIYLEDEKTFVLVNQDLSLALVQALARRAKQLGVRLKLL